MPPHLCLFLCICLPLSLLVFFPMGRTQSTAPIQQQHLMDEFYQGPPRRLIYLCNRQHSWHLKLPRQHRLLPISSFSMPEDQFHNHGITLRGDAHILHDDHHSFVRLGNASGGLMIDNPVQLIQPTSSSEPIVMSFATNFTFSISPSPPPAEKYVPPPTVSFHFLRNYTNDEEFGNSTHDCGYTIQLKANRQSDNEVLIKYGPSILDSAYTGLVLDSGNKFYAWIDYRGRTKTLEVRLSESHARPDDPLLMSKQFDFLDDHTIVWFGIGVSTMKTHANIYSWNFDVFKDDPDHHEGLQLQSEL